MGIETTLFNIFAGNKAAEEAKKAERDIVRRTDTEQSRQEGVNQPFLSAGTRGVNALADYALSAPGTLDPVSQALEDQVARGITGRFAAMGLNDSGAHTNALAQALIPLRSGLRQNRLGELMMPAQFGPGAAGRFNQTGQFATNMFANARRGEGEAGAFPWLNAANSLYRWENQILDATGNALGGGFQ